MLTYLRKKYLNAFQNAIDAGYEYLMFERLTKDELGEINNSRLILMTELERMKKIVKSCEEKYGNGEVNVPSSWGTTKDVGKLAAQAKFTWKEHDKKVITNKLKFQLELLEKQLANLDESNV